MPKILGIEKKTENPFVNLYQLQVEDRKGKPGKYYVASRARSQEQLELVTRIPKPDGVVIYSLYGEKGGPGGAGEAVPLSHRRLYL